ncbi:MAG: plasmid pRiA4b ORF-3 family protein [Methanomicrobiales archaeon]|jgi:hypothetical protein|nr:plasmid pRiA4b ORF-3 family protein [Methanomicrobiales archaeon]
MQIALTKKLAQAMGVKPTPPHDTTEPLFSWTANWVNTFSNRKEDMVVMVNNATCFTVLIYGVKRDNFSDIAEKMTTAIRNTLLAMNLNPEAVEEYLRQAGEVEFVSNYDRKATAWVSRQGKNGAYFVGRCVNETGGVLKFSDSLGYAICRYPVNYSKRSADQFCPDKEIIKGLVKLTGKPAYKYRAFEILITLDLEIYKAKRRLIVPADIEFPKLHKVLQNVFGWKNCHIHDFNVFDNESNEIVSWLVMNEATSFYDDDAVVETGHKLSEYFPKYTKIVYTYDMGDSWEHEITFVRVIEEHNEESPYLLEASGQTPPEDVGGVYGFLEFREIMLDPNHPDYAETKEWAGYWSPELREWDTKPKVIW